VRELHMVDGSAPAVASPVKSSVAPTAAVTASPVEQVNENS